MAQCESAGAVDTVSNVKHRDILSEWMKKKTTMINIIININCTDSRF